jgi:predicted aconitase
LDADAVDEDWMKAFGAAAASSGGVAMFHVVGVTPEAPDLATAIGDGAPSDRLTVTLTDLRRARRDLSTGRVDASLGGVSLGTPHASAQQLRAIADHLGGQTVRVPTYVSTSRRVLASVPDAAARLAVSGVQVVLDTCTYISAIMRPDGVVMTNSAKWAYYAPANLGFDVVLASQAECLDSALTGHIRLED